MFARILLLTALAFTLSAEEKSQEEKIPSALLKTGTLLSAAALAEKPAIDTPYGEQKNSSPCWIEVTVKPDAGRSVSIHDYVLTADGTEYPCVAVAPEGEGYSGSTWKLEQLDGSRNFKLLVPVPSKDAVYRIKFKLLPTSLPAPKLEISAPDTEEAQASPEKKS